MFTTTSERLERFIAEQIGRTILNLRVEIVPGTVHIFGETTRFYDKQMAQELIRSQMRDLRIENRIVVRRAVHSNDYLAVFAS